MGIWKTHISWTKDFVRDNISIIEKNYKKFPFKNRWSADGTNVHTVHSDDRDGSECINFSFLGKEYEKVVKKFSKDNNLNGEYKIGDIWYNYYKNGQYQTPHKHQGEFAAIHYLKFNRYNHSVTKFMDSELKMPFVREGTLVIFPAHYMHYVEPQTSNIPRLTVSFGFY
tara:strand:- start:306 stop:812 length:507 start_codon:yes stop_codon:yes gene_type:complete